MNAAWILIFLLVLSSIPVAVIFAWFRLAKYQFSTVWFFLALLAGAAAFFPALIFQDLLNISFTAGSGGRAELFYHVFVRIAFTEEFSRFLLLLVFFGLSSFFKLDEGTLPKQEADVSYAAVKKGAAAGLVAGLGFAVLESAVYAASSPHVLLIRAITAAPLHAACGSRIGSAAKLIRISPVQAVLRIFTATAIHGIYNFMISLPGFFSIAAVLVALTAFGSSVLAIRGGWSSEGA